MDVESGKTPQAYVARVLTVIAVAVSAEACARVLQTPLQQPNAAVMAELWREPSDLESRDLYHGVGGPELIPQPVTYTFVAHKTTGKNPGYDVRDPEGRLWAVKLGEESQSESPVITANSNGNLVCAAASCAATRYWAEPPVPVSPKTAKRAESGRRGSVTVGAGIVATSIGSIRPAQPADTDSTTITTRTMCTRVMGRRSIIGLRQGIAFGM